MKPINEKGKKRPKSKAEKRSKKNLGNFKISLKAAKDYNEYGIVGRWGIKVDLKDHNSFLFAKDQIIRLIENGLQLFRSLPSHFKNEVLNDIVYIPDFGCYFLAFGKNIYTKTIDTNPVALFMKIDSLTDSGGSPHIRALMVGAISLVLGHLGPSGDICSGLCSL